MFKKTVKYKDFNDADRVEVLYFHMLTPEWADMQFNPTFQNEGGMQEYVKIAMATGEGLKIYTLFKLMIVNSYGLRSEDGSKFTKKSEYTEAFLNSPAYEAFFEWLVLDVSDGSHADEFWAGIMPERIKKELELDDGSTVVAAKKHVKDMTREELLAAYNEKLSGKSIEGSAV